MEQRSQYQFLLDYSTCGNVYFRMAASSSRVKRTTLTEAVCLDVALTIGVAILTPDRNQFPIKRKTDKITAHTAPATTTAGTIYF